MNTNSLRNTMKKIITTARVALVVFAFAVTFVMPQAAYASLLDGFDLDLGGSLDLIGGGDLIGDVEVGDLNVTGGDLVFDTDTTLVTTECLITINTQQVAYGGSVVVSWNTQGFDTIRINGDLVSGADGDVTISNITENSDFTLTASDSNSNSTCTSVVSVICLPPPVLVCELDIHKVVNKSNAAPGDELVYEITVKNTGTGPCTGNGVKIVDALHPYFEYQSFTYVGDLTPGYGTKPVYDSNTRTLYFNAKTLSAGEQVKIAVMGKIIEPNTCGDYHVTNQAKVTSAEYNNFLTWEYSETVRTDVDNDCDVPVKPECPFDPADGRTIIYFDDVRLRSDQSQSSAMSDVVSTSIMAGQYDVSLASWDGYIGRESVTQPNEQWKLGLISSAGTQYSGVIKDIPDFVREATVTEKVNTDLVVSQTVTGVKAVHAYYPDTSSANSVNPICAALDKKVDPVVPQCDSFIASPDAIMTGGSATLTWETTNATRVVINNGIGEVNADDSLVVSPLADTTYILSVFDGSNQVADSCHTTVHVSDDPVPVCKLFTANPSNLPVGGGNVTLTWEVEGATSVSISPTVGAVALNDSTVVGVTAATTFILTAVDGNGDEVSCQAPVTVADPNPFTCEGNVTFTSNRSSITAGESIELNWTVTDADTVSVNPGSFSGLTGTETVSPTTDTTYTLTATRGNDTINCPISVDVEPVEEVFTCENNVTFTVNDRSITRGQSVILDWNVVDADTVSISTIGTTNLTGTQSVSPSADITYVLTATKGSQSVECPVSVDVSSGGGGGGSSSPRCDLDISDTKITRGEEITLKWDTTRAREIKLVDDRGNVLFDTEDMNSDDAEDYEDGEIDLRPTRDTKYTLIVERGSRDRECEVEVEVENELTVLQTRDQQPLVAGIALSNVPYTGFEAGPVLTLMFYLLLMAWALYVAYFLVLRQRSIISEGQVTVSEGPSTIMGAEHMKRAETVRPDVFPAAVAASTATAPANLPTGTQEPKTVGYESYFGGHAVTMNTVDAIVTELENRAHEQKALLSSDAIEYFMRSTEGEIERNAALDEVITEAKKHYPLEDGWIVINEARMQSLCEACVPTATTVPEQHLPTGKGSLAEAIVTGNVAAAYAMIGNRPMFALADAAADLDSVVRARQGKAVITSNLLKEETAKLTDSQIENMIKALTGALDGTYTDEASAVKMAIMKAVKEVA